MATNTTNIALRAPITAGLAHASSTSSTPDHAPPSPAWLTGKWHVTHSTLPMWKSKRNVTITYTSLPDSTPPKIDDLVEYQGLGSTKLKSVHGVDSPVPDAAGWAWDWRGKGWLVIASSRWEVLGYGDEPGSEGAAAGGAEVQSADRRQWAVTYFAKTLFTPAGIDIYSRHPEGLKRETLEEIKKQLAGFEDEGLRKLADTLFEVKLDDARKE